MGLWGYCGRVGLHFSGVCLGLVLPLAIWELLFSGGLLSTRSVGALFVFTFGGLCAAGFALIWSKPRAKQQHPATLAVASAIVAGSIAWITLDPTIRRAALVYYIFVGAIASYSGVCTWLTARASPWRWVICGCGIALTAATFLTLKAFQYQELRDAAVVVLVCALLPVAAITIKLLRPRPRFHYASATSAVVVVSGLFVCAHADRWPSEGLWHGSVSPSLTKAGRWVFDYDRDGYSGILWGGDCDDVDAQRNPMQTEQADGHDRNCNGAALDANPTAAQRQLTDAFGKPSASKRSTQVLLLTIDTLRADVVADHAPHLHAIGQRGIRFNRLYAGATCTNRTLKRILSPARGSRPFTQALRHNAIDVRTIGGENGSVLRALDSEASNSERLPGDHTEDRIAATMQALKTHDRLFLWTHLMDPHAPYTSERILTNQVSPSLAHINKKYLGDIETMDSKLATLLDWLISSGWLENNVLIITSDHGEMFGENGKHDHCHGHEDAVVLVPGYLVGNGAPAVTYPHIASHRDIAATVLGAFGLDEPALSAETLGRSWWRLCDRIAPLHRGAMVHTARQTSGARPTMLESALFQNNKKVILGAHDMFRATYVRSGKQWKRSNNDASLLRSAAAVNDIDGFPAIW